MYLGLDFGGTKLAVGLVEGNGHVVDKRRRPTDSDSGGLGALSAMRQMVDEMGVTAADITAVGISFGGPVNSQRLRTLLSHHGPGWVDYPLVDEVVALWGRPTEMDNDANAAALGEFRFGAGRGSRSMIYLTVSTGIGGGLVIDGELYRGRRGLAGEIGHTIVQPGGPMCTCGKQGCLEAVAAGPSISNAYALATGVAADSVTAADVFDSAARGDSVAAQVVADAIHFLGIGVSNAINVLDPDIFVIGGGVTRAGPALFEPLRAAVRATIAPSPIDSVPVVPAQLDDVVGIVGAVALVADRL